MGNIVHFDEILSKKSLERAVLVGVISSKTPREKVESNLEELALLADTAGAIVVKTFFQKMESPVRSTFVGKGKLEEIAAFVVDNKIDIVLFDDDLSPSQVRNIDEIVNTKVLDRTGLILHIFSERAKSAQARAQVELAQLQWMLPRLAGLWSHLSRQKGGIGMKGAGEKEIETDRRIIRKKIDKLKDQLEKIDKQSITRRKGREQVVRVSLVGYTNAGKSTLLNTLAKTNTFAENKLFATLDSTIRRVYWDGYPFLISDTVGFIRKLPHELVECFKSTLDEVRESDLLLHVADISNAGCEEQIHVVKQTLFEMGAGEKPVIMVFNKADQLDEETRASIENSWIARENAPFVFISAEKKENVNELKKEILKRVKDVYKEKYPNLALKPFYDGQDWESEGAEERESGEEE